MELIERNKYDIMLYNFAMKLVKARLATFESLDSSSTMYILSANTFSQKIYPTFYSAM